MRCRLIVRVLWDKFAADGEVEDGLAELVDVFGAGGEAREVVEVEAGAVFEGGAGAGSGLAPPLFRPCRVAATRRSRRFSRFA